ncbi:MAG: hypothetical protein JWO44_1925 [Bacteroidetes bacterium]|jgi:hypothetical protein|nr:hypothetical protein [Bacteroidota bacterium]
MNKIRTYSILLIALLYGFSAAAIETDTIINKKPVKKNDLKQKMFVPPIVIKTSPTAVLYGAIFPPFTAEYRLMMEISSGKRQSEQLGISYLGVNLLLNAIEKAAGVTTDDIYKVEGWRIQYAHKFYWIGRRHYAPFGFYVAPMFSYSNARVAIGLKRYYQGAYFDFRHFNINGIIGVQAGKINRVTFDIYGGLGYKSNKVYYHFTSYKILPYDTKDFGPLYNSHLNGVFGINIGYAF